MKKRFDLWRELYAIPALLGSLFVVVSAQVETLHDATFWGAAGVAIASA